MSDDLCGVFVTDVHDLRYNYEAPNTRNIKKKKNKKKLLHYICHAETFFYGCVNIQN